MKKNILFVCAFIFVLNANAQIAGLSASKLTTLSASTVALHQIEFEPSFMISSQNNVFDNSFNFRFTYGLMKNVEAGFYLPIDVAQFASGIKFLLLNTKFQFSPIIGVAFDFVDKKFFDNLGCGFVSTYNFSENFSTDIDFHFLNNFSGNNSLSLGLDNGLYVNGIQYIIGLNYLQNNEKNNFQRNLLVNTGITVEQSQNFLLVFFISNSLYQYHSENSMSFNFALTISID